MLAVAADLYDMTYRLLAAAGEKKPRGAETGTEEPDEKFREAVKTEAELLSESAERLRRAADVYAKRQHANRERH